MDKRKIELIVTAILVGVFLLFLTNTVIKFSSKKKKITARATRRLSKKITDLKAKKQAKRQIIKEPLGWGRDPFVLAEGDTSKVASLVFGGILWDSKHPKVILNNEVYKEGDKIGDIEIVKITKDGIVFKEGGKTRKVTLD